MILLLDLGRRWARRLKCWVEIKRSGRKSWLRGRGLRVGLFGVWDMDGWDGDERVWIRGCCSN